MYSCSILCQILLLLFRSCPTLQPQGLQHSIPPCPSPPPGVYVTSDAVCLAAQLCLTLHDSTDCSPPGFSVHADSQGKNIGAGCHALIIIYLTIFPLLAILVSFRFCMPINVEVNIMMHTVCSIFQIISFDWILRLGINKIFWIFLWRWRWDQEEYVWLLIVFFSVTNTAKELQFHYITVNIGNYCEFFLLQYVEITNHMLVYICFNYLKAECSPLF